MPITAATTPTPPANPVAFLTITFFDAYGALIDGHTLPTAEAIAKASEFMRTHGTDPEMDGQGAAKGRIIFAPSSGPRSA